MPRSKAPRIPYYAQTADFSCGAACLVMALAALRGTPRTRAMEFELWREATTIGIPGIDKWGLTIPALRRGVEATVITPSVMMYGSLAKDAKGLFTPDEIELTEFAQAENRKAARREGVGWVRRRPTMADARTAVERGNVPILFVDLGIWKGERVPHWAVVAEARGERVLVHDPDPDGPRRRRMTEREAWAATDMSYYNADPAVVVLGP